MDDRLEAFTVVGIGGVYPREGVSEGVDVWKLGTTLRVHRLHQEIGMGRESFCDTLELPEVLDDVVVSPETAPLLSRDSYEWVVLAGSSLHPEGIVTPRWHVLPPTGLQGVLGDLKASRNAGPLLLRLSGLVDFVTDYHWGSPFESGR